MWNIKGGGGASTGRKSIIEVATRFIPRRKKETCQEVEMKKGVGGDKVGQSQIGPICLATVFLLC